MQGWSLSLIANQRGVHTLRFDTSVFRHKLNWIVSLCGRQAVLKTVMTLKGWGFDSSAIRQVSYFLQPTYEPHLVWFSP